jgi:uncharacterized protein
VSAPEAAWPAALEVESTGEGVVFSVRAKPSASRDGIVGVHDGALKVSVTAAPEKGKANKAILALLAKALGRPGRDMEIVSGLTANRKKVLARGLDSATLYRSLTRRKP